MLIRIRHRLVYDYARPVFIEPTLVRLTPRQDRTQRLIEHDLRVDPEPEGAAWAIESDGVDARSLWFAGEHATLRIEAESLVETLRLNPFDAIVTHADAITLPVRHRRPMDRALRPFLEAPIDDSVRDWAHALASSRDDRTLPFLMHAIETTHREWTIETRLDGEPRPAAETLATRRGACRDLVMLIMDACRSVGIPARFVSGYSIHHPPDALCHELHAWAEVHLPGMGWRGFDPTLGLAVADGHVALASGPDHTLAAVVSGTFRGTDVHDSMEYAVDVRRVESSIDEPCMRHS